MTLPGERETLAFLGKLLASDVDVQGRFLPGLTADEITMLHQRLTPLARRTLEWTRDWSIFSSSMVVPVAIVNLVQFPLLSEDAVLLRTKHSLWVTALDDVFDDRRSNSTDVQRILRQCMLVACGLEPAEPLSELPRSLSEIRLDLAQFPFFDAVSALWVASLVRTLDAMAAEFWARARVGLGVWESPPSLDEYLFSAAESSAVAHLWITGLAIDSDPTLLDCLTELNTLAEQCALVVRLANDLASYERESVEGVTNSVAIYAHELGEQGCPVRDREGRARLAVTERLGEARRQLYTLASESKTKSGVEQSFVRATILTERLYARGDIREWSNVLHRQIS